MTVKMTLPHKHMIKETNQDGGNTYRFLRKQRCVAKKWWIKVCIMIMFMQCFYVVLRISPFHNDPLAQRRTHQETWVARPETPAASSLALKMLVVHVCLGLGFLAGSFGVNIFRLAIVILYIVGDVGVFAAIGNASSYDKEMAAFLSSLISLVMGILLSYTFQGRKGLDQAMQTTCWVQLMPVSACFTISTLCQMYATTFLSSVLVKALLQLKLPVTVLLSAKMLKRRYNVLQTIGLMTVLLVATTFPWLKLDAPARAKLLMQSGSAGSVVLGFLLTAIAVGSNVVGALLSELAFKNYPNIGICANMVHFKVGELLVSTSLLLVRHRLGFLRSFINAALAFDTSAWLVVSMLILDAWMSALLVKHQSAVGKAVAKSLSLIVLCTLTTKGIFAMGSSRSVGGGFPINALEVFPIMQILMVFLFFVGMALSSFARWPQSFECHSIHWHS